MSDFNPGEGWREVADGEDLGDREVLVFYRFGRQQRWVHEEPVPPLPTELYTVIRVTWRDCTAVFTLVAGDMWFEVGTGKCWNAKGLTEYITDWELLARPVS